MKRNAKLNNSMARAGGRKEQFSIIPVSYGIGFEVDAMNKGGKKKRPFYGG